LALCPRLEEQDKGQQDSDLTNMNISEDVVRLTDSGYILAADPIHSVLHMLLSDKSID
jgi:hypothetical protein